MAVLGVSKVDVFLQPCRTLFLFTVNVEYVREHFPSRHKESVHLFSQILHVIEQKVSDTFFHNLHSITQVIIAEEINVITHLGCYEYCLNHHLYGV